MKAKKKTLYTNDILFRLIVNQLKAENLLPDHLDYWLPNDYHPVNIKTVEWDVFGITTFGGCEGIYLSMCVKGYIGDGKTGTFELGTFKTLETDKEAYKDMCNLGAEFVFALRDFVDDHWDDFDQDGYKIIGYKDGQPDYGCYIARTLDEATKRAHEVLGYEWKAYDYMIIKDRCTGKETRVTRCCIDIL